MKKQPWNCMILAAFLGSFLLAGSVLAVDVMEGNAKAPPPGLNGFMATYVNVDVGDQYVASQKQGFGHTTHIEQLLLRYTRTFSIADNPAVFYVQPSFGKVSGRGILANQPGTEGMGDTAFAFAYWPYANHQAGDYLALVGYLVAPTGEYDSSQIPNLSLGQDRYKAAFQLGYQTAINDKLDAMFVVDAMWHEDIDAVKTLTSTVKLEQDTLYSSQLSLMYKPSAQYLLGASYIISKGGEKTYDGVAQNDAADNSRYQLTARGRFSFGELIFQYGGDIDVENGFFIDNKAMLRYQLVWK